MTRGKINIKNPERFKGNYSISADKLNMAIKRATDKLLSKLDMYKTSFPQNMKRDGADCRKYKFGENNGWICGMHTGTLILAYQLTDDERFLDAVREHIPTYRKRVDEKVTIQDHDVGFVFCPSCVSLYKVAGDEEAKNIALEAAEYFYNHSYSEKGGFIIRYANALPDAWACRTMMDTLMNAPLLFWAGEQTGNEKYTNAAKSQLDITEKYLIREDGSSYHHYQFDVETHAPVKGVTFQGNRDESTWSRGQSWGVYGFAMGYDYTGDSKMLDVQKDIVAYTLNNLPDDNIPYWDYDFSNGSGEPRDTSAAMITACGLLEATKYMSVDAPEREIYYNAACMITESIIDKYARDTDDDGNEYDGLFWGCTGARKFEMGIEGCAVYGDYFYLEALLRLTNPEWKRLW